MAAKVLNGREISEAIKKEVRASISGLSFKPCLAVVRVGEDPASAVYVGGKVKTSEELGMHSRHYHLSAETSQAELLALVGKLNRDPDVDGILVQLPLPPQVDETAVVESIDPAKDVDGFHPINVGRLSLGEKSLVPCTPAGVIEILKRSGIEIAGRRAVVVGRSNIVGKPMAMLLLRENATVTVCHSKTADLPSVTREADILIAAIGRPGFLRAEHIRDCSAVIDVGINSVSDTVLLGELFSGEDLTKRLATVEKRGATLVGDVADKDAAAKAGCYTPVPGGVGLLTVAMLMKNTVQAAIERRSNI